MTFNIDCNEIQLEFTEKGLRLTTNSSTDLLLANVSAEETQETVTKNYAIVKYFFQERTENKIDHSDIEKIALKIVLYYFYMYQLWRSMYEKEKDRDLTFIVTDFDHPQTADMIISYFKKSNPKDYIDKCLIMLSMSKEKFNDYEIARQAFFNR
jgi:hypothetical protein